MKNRNKVTQKMIAEHTGVDQRTVSQALNGRGRIAAATREKILQAAHNLGYRPNLSAQAIRGGKEKRIGLMLGLNSRLSNLPHARFLGMQVAALEESSSLSICTFPEKAFSSDQELGRFLGNFGVDGMLVNFEQDTRKQLLEILNHFNIPVIVLNARLKENCVYHDNWGISQKAVNKLLASGIKNFLYVDYGPRLIVEKGRSFHVEHFSSKERREGIANALGKRKIPVKALCVDQSEDICQWLHLCKKNGEKTAIICSNELTAQRVMFFLSQAGFVLPEDALLIYFGRGPFSDNVLDRHMRLLKLPEFQMGRQAVKMLMHRIENGAPLPSTGVSCSDEDVEMIVSQESFLLPPSHELFQFAEEQKDDKS